MTCIQCREGKYLYKVLLQLYQVAGLGFMFLVVYYWYLVLVLYYLGTFLCIILCGMAFLILLYYIVLVLSTPTTLEYREHTKMYR
jgi:hypothetical protein